MWRAHHASSISSESSDDCIAPLPDHVENITTVKNVHPSQPIYSTPSASLTATNIFILCFGEVGIDQVCKTKPTGIRCNAVFVVDLNKLILNPFTQII
jgi:hypothetical protein